MKFLPDVRWTPCLVVIYTSAALALFLVLFSSCGREASNSGSMDSAFHDESYWKADRAQATSSYCRECHQDVFEAWETSHHHFANQVIEDESHAARFHGKALPTADGGSLTFIREGKRFYVRVQNPAGENQKLPAHMVLAHTPLQQLLIATDAGSWQVTQQAWDPEKEEWFDVFADDRRAGEWGHWTGRGMNWNSQCAACHMTEFDKNYQPELDTFQSRWAEQGISCVQCHGRMEGHETADPVEGSWKLSDAQVMDTCFSCHSRREELTAQFSPGEDFHDHYRLQLLSNPDLYYPDGQIKDEVFVAGSFLQSKMHAAGVRCQDCHEPHTQELLFPIEDNALCMSCHSPPGRLNAPPVEPVAHSHHPSGSTGNRCVECHMPQTTYMQRDPRRDHGFHSPDPKLSLELGIPNACNRCHQDQSEEWAWEKVQAWYPREVLQRERPRTLAVAAAQAGDPEAGARLLQALQTEDRPLWRASLLDLLEAYPQTPGLDALARDSLASDHPLLRAAGARLGAVLPRDPDPVWRQAALNDPVRRVRFEALESRLRNSSSNASLPGDYWDYLQLHTDQPSGAAKLSQVYFSQDQLPEALKWMQRALLYDPTNAGLYRDLARLQNTRQKIPEAEEAFARAIELAPGNPQFLFEQGLFFAEHGKLDEAIQSLDKAVSLEPRLHRAHYNLGLAQAQRRRWLSAIRALNTAVALEPHNLDYQYTLAILHHNAGNPEKAKSLARSILRQDPTYEPARTLLRRP